MNVPSIVVAQANVCPKAVWRIKNIPTAPTVPLSAELSQLVQNATTALNTMLASHQFEAAVGNGSFDPAQTNGLSPAQIFNLMTTRSPIQISVTLYTNRNFLSGNEGFESDQFPTVAYGNLRMIKGKPGFLASLLLHEVMHILGFSHLNKRTYSGSVPYTMNRIYEETARSLNLPLP